jgi:hypothetical protein
MYRKESAMAIIIREIQKVRPGQWEALEAAEPKWAAFEERTGFSRKRKRYRVFSGTEDMNTIVIEFEFDSFTELDAAYKRGEADPEYEVLMEELYQIISSSRVELYTVLD